MSLSYHLVEVVKHYWSLGFISFGGPGVHVVILRKRFVDKLKWVDSKTYLDLFALGNALPGPGSTQLAFSIAVVTHGVLAGLVAFLFWSLPGAIGMAGLGVGVSRIPDSLPGAVLALLTGFNAAAVGLIALAAVQLAANAATDRVTLMLLWLSASFGICYHAPWMYPTLIAAAGAITLAWDFRRNWLTGPIRRLRQPRRPDVSPVEMDTMAETPAATEGPDDKAIPPASVAEPDILPARQDKLKVVSVRVAIALLVAFALLLAVPLGTRAGLQNAGKTIPRALDFFCNMIIAGTIIFGGGPVVIPLLRDYVVVEGWVSSRDFLLVFAILQAFPGPNFNFAVALGVLAVSNNPALGAFAGFIGIFAPGIVLKLALLPLYSSWRDKSVARSVLRGLNAAASGLVFTAVWQLFLVGYIYEPATGSRGDAQTVSGPLTSDPFWAVVASCSFLATRSYNSPPAVSIIGGGLAGLAWYGVRQSG